MDSSDTQSAHTLTDEQLTILASVVLQEFGPRLTHPQFDEVVLAIFEHIPGFETLPTKRSIHYRRYIWVKYRQVIQANQHRH